MVTDHLHFTLDGDPIPKGRPRNFGKRTVTPQRTRDAEASIRERVTLLDLTPYDGPVAVSLTFWCRTHRRTDLDNMVKLVTDALNGLAYTDDHLIHRLTARLYRSAIGEAPRTEVRIESLGSAA